jgi:hypothetical protein
MRKSFNINQQTTIIPDPPQPLRARRPVSKPDVSPTVARLARPPTIPGIFEDDENEPLGQAGLSTTPHRRKTKMRTSMVLAEEDVPLIQFDEDMTKAGKRKPTRRQSGLLTTKMAVTVSDVLSQRPPSPAFGSPLRRDAALDQDDEVIAVIEAPEYMDQDADGEPIPVAVSRKIKRRKSKEQDERESEREKVAVRDGEEGSPLDSNRREREKRRARESDETTNRTETKKPKLKDVTNSPPPRPSLATLEIPSGMMAIMHINGSSTKLYHLDRDRQRTPERDYPPASFVSNSAGTTLTSSRNFLTPVATPLPRMGTAHDPSHRESPPRGVSESEMQVGARERRVRKSINYAEPKLNT